MYRNNNGGNSDVIIQLSNNLSNQIQNIRKEISDNSEKSRLEIESKLKPVILSPQLISSAAIKKQKIVSPNQIIEFNDFLFLIFNKIKIPNIEEIKY